MDFGALRRENQRQLIEFVRTDLELARTFVELALRHLEKGDQDGYGRLLGKTRRAIESVHHFEGKISDQHVRAEIQLELEMLETFLFLRQELNR